MGYGKKRPYKKTGGIFGKKNNRRWPKREVLPVSIKKVMVYTGIVIAGVLLYTGAVSDKLATAGRFFTQGWGNSSENISIHDNILIDDSHLTTMEPVMAEEAFVPTFNNIGNLSGMDEYTKYIYNIDAAAYVTPTDIQADILAGYNLKTEIFGDEPKILIFHTHSQEDFIDSRPGEINDTIVGVGHRLAEILALDYGVSVVHDTGQYDIQDGKLQRGASYETMEPAVEKILQKYPSIEVTIDLHRDGVPDNVHLVTDIDGKPTAKIMFFNGITRYNRNGEPVEMPNLENPYIQENLALSLQMFLTANEAYPGIARKIYIKPYRYSLHLKPKSMLVEVGANTNTVEEAMNAMPPLADILMQVLGE